MFKIITKEIKISFLHLRNSVINKIKFIKRQNLYKRHQSSDDLFEEIIFERDFMVF